MDVDKYIQQLNKLKELDVEMAHREADRILLLALRELGQEKLAEAWEECREHIGFWYA